MAKVVIGVDSLSVQLGFWERVLGVHGNLTVPSSCVLGAQVLGKGWIWNLGLRIGTGVPGAAIAGTFIKKGDWAYVAWFRKQEVLQINLQGHRYNRIVVGVSDAKALADAINMSLASC